MSRPISPELVLSPDLWISNTPRYFSFAFRECMHLKGETESYYYSQCIRSGVTLDQHWFHQPIILSTNYMTSIPSLTELWVVSIEHLQRVWLAIRERLPFRTHDSVPLFGTCFCSNCWDQIPRTCNVFARLFTWNTPWHFLDFPLFKDVHRDSVQ